MTIRNDDLINAAREARKNAYSRYSNYSVGAAIIDDQGRLHVGCNVENAAYNLGNCAEAAAIAAMVQEGGKRIVRIAVAGGYAEIGPCTPCGGCRQRINEFADKNTVVIVIDDSKEWQEYSVAGLLPESFHLD
ncbi:MAG: cytidine deaminase [Gammaproteobacteria bacterium]|nr:cytidine deaminase [Gammaproteobacteria bacterium]MBT8111719.1 cytidine deaminase [Gammaproteobacteria bacterium]NND47597.1 cytidine deaminase [Woeseiaceae bacterium]NNL46418.1 cytidine deaminase [Woeseiaceae bacterium]